MYEGVFVSDEVIKSLEDTVIKQKNMLDKYWDFYESARKQNESLLKKLEKALNLAEAASASRMMAIEQVEALQDEVQNLKQQVSILEDTRDLLRDGASVN
jgi:LPS O-antigen subunit length determinant protein (WzzB/FepE family)